MIPGKHRIRLAKPSFTSSLSMYDESEYPGYELSFFDDYEFYSLSDML